MIYQVIDGQRVPVAGQFQLIDDHTYSFDVTGTVDPTENLVIDPDLVWSTYLGGTGDDMAQKCAATDEFLYLTGSTMSTTFGGLAGSQPVATDGNIPYVAQVSAAGGVFNWVEFIADMYDLTPPLPNPGAASGMDVATFANGVVITGTGAFPRRVRRKFGLRCRFRPQRYAAMAKSAGDGDVRSGGVRVPRGWRTRRDCRGHRCSS